MYVLGDGYTDYQMREAGLAQRFYAYTENVARPAVVAHADQVLPTFDEFLYQLKLPMTLSYPKNRIRVLLLESPDARAAELFRHEGYQVEEVPGALDEAELLARIEGVSILGIRSKTQVTARVLAAANRLIGIGAFCIGTNQIDLAEAMKKGVAVFNAPYSNTRSVVELALAEIIVLARRVPEKNPQMHRGEWEQVERRRLVRDSGQNAGHRGLRQHRGAALGAGRSRGPEGDVLRRGRKAPARQRREVQDPGRIAAPGRHRDAAHRRPPRKPGLLRSRRICSYEAGGLVYQQRPGPRGRCARPGRRPAAAATSAARRWMCFRTSPKTNAGVV